LRSRIDDRVIWRSGDLIADRPMLRLFSDRAIARSLDRPDVESPA
jgi:hypothetical protein